MTPNPSAITVTAGAAGQTSLTVTPSGGFSGNVALALANAPAGVTLAPTTISVSGVTTTQMALTTATMVAAGTYQLDLQGTSGTLSTTAMLTLTVNQPASASAFIYEFHAPSSVPAPGGNLGRQGAPIEDDPPAAVEKRLAVLQPG